MVWHPAIPPDSREGAERTAGTWIRLIRQALDLTQQELAKHLIYSRDMIRKIEADERRISPEAAERFAHLASVPPEQYDQFLRVIRGTGLAPAPLLRLVPDLTDVAPLPPNPYRGLNAFREDDAPNFFGRERLAGILADAVAAHAVTSVVGPSGSGKSSLVRAGLLPKLQAMGGWEVVDLRPGDGPFSALGTALAGLVEPDLGGTERLLAASRLTQALRTGELGLGHVFARVRQARPDVRAVLLLVDQFEELYTTGVPAQERDTFINAVLPAAQTDGWAAPWHTVLTLRADFLGSALNHPTLGRVMQNGTVLVPGMLQPELRAAIEGPAAQQDVTFEPGLVERMLSEHGQDGALPLLEFTLSRLWTLQRQRVISHAAYDQLGGVRHALVTHADATFDQLSPERQSEARHVFMQLVNPGDGSADTKRTARLVDLGQNRWPLITQLATARLVVTSYDEHARTETVELAHEALLTGWPRLQGWLAEDRAFRTWQEGVRARAREWLRSGEDPEQLLRGTVLTSALGWLRVQGGNVLGEERRYLMESQAQLLRSRSRTTERQKALVGGFSTLAAVLLCTVAILLQILRLPSREELARRLVDAANSELLAAQDKALLLATEAARILPGSPLTQGTLGDALFHARQLMTYLQSQPGRLFGMAVSPDGKQVAAGGTDHVVWVWNVDGSGPPRALRGHRSWVVDAVFSPDGLLLATAGADRRVLLWDLSGGRAIGELTGHTREVLSVSFSSDGKRLAAGGTDKTVRVWDVASRTPIGRPLTGHTDEVSAVAFSPDGRHLFSGGFDGKVLIWDPQIPEPLSQVATHSGMVWGMAATKDGTSLVTAGFDGTILISDRHSGTVVQTLHTPAGAPAARLALSADGRLLAAGVGGDVHVWGMPKGDVALPPLKGHSAFVFAVAFSPDSRKLVSTGFDGAVRVWDLSTGASVGEPLTPPGDKSPLSGVSTGPGGVVAAVAGDGSVRRWNQDQPVPPMPAVKGGEAAVLSATFGGGQGDLLTGDGAGTLRWWSGSAPALAHAEPLAHNLGVRGIAVAGSAGMVATVGGDGRLAVWSLRDRARQAEVNAHPAGSTLVAISPDGRFAATGGTDVTVKLWHIPSLAPAGPPLTGHEGAIASLAFDPSGTVLASGGNDGKVFLWDVAAGRQRVDTGASREGPASAGSLNHRGAVRSLAFSGDGSVLFAGTEDARIHLWSVASRQPIGPGFSEHDDLEAHSGPVTGLARTADGRGLVSVGADGTARVRSVDFQQWPQLACEFARRNLTQQEWQEHLPGHPYRQTCEQYPPGP